MPPKASPTTVVGAKVNINGRVEIERPRVVWAAASPGQDVHLVVKYHIEEASALRESYRIVLESTVGGETRAAVERKHSDTPLVRDEMFGFVGHRFCFRAPGVYRGTFRCTVEYGQGNWLGRDEDLRREVVEVPVELHIK